MLFSYTEVGTGFVHRENAFVLLMLGLPLIMMLLLDYIVKQRFESLAVVRSGGQLLRAGVLASYAGALPAVAGLLISAPLAVNERVRFGAFYAFCAVSAAVAVILLLPSAWGKHVKSDAECSLSMLPVAWGVVALLVAHVSNITIATIPENVYTLLGAAALLLALYAEAKLRGLGMGLAYLRWTQVAALLLTFAILPQMLLRLSSSRLGLSAYFVSKCPAIDIGLSGFVPMMWQRLAAAESNGRALLRSRATAGHTP